MSQSCQGTPSMVPSLISFFYFFPQKKKGKKSLYTLHPQKVFRKFMENSLPLVTESELFFMHNKGEQELMIHAQIGYQTYPTSSFGG